MTALRLSEDPADLRAADILIVPFFSGAQGIRAALPEALDGTGWRSCALAAFGRDRRFRARAGEVAASLLALDPADGPDLLAVGLGAQQDLGMDVVRRAAFATAVATRGRRRIATVLAGLGTERVQAVRAVAEGMLLGRHRAGERAPADPEESSIAIALGEGECARAEVRRALEVGIVAGRMANWCRDLVETPANLLTPERLAATIAERARALGIGVEVWNQAELAAHGFGGTLAVGAASAHPPTVAVLTGSSNQGVAPLGLVGKGVTFDSGGINLKRDRAEIAQMKNDMAGAAAVAGAIFAAVELGARPDVIAILPMAENMPGSRAQRPGDVVTHPGGQRTEVIDTDSEGRLVLADAIAYLVQRGVAGIVDVGTLTDGGGVGPLHWGCWGTGETLAGELLAAGVIAGEPGWRLPLHTDYLQFLESRTADVANAPRTTPDSGLMAATYLRTFAGEVPWAHIDNGGSAYLESDFAGWTAGATGSPMRALLQFLLDRG